MGLGLSLMGLSLMAAPQPGLGLRLCLIDEAPLTASAAATASLTLPATFLAAKRLTTEGGRPKMAATSVGSNGSAKMAAADLGHMADCRGPTRIPYGMTGFLV